ncbi:MAG: hypothetical protein WCB92_12980 [Mycobacterium sp.]
MSDDPKQIAALEKTSPHLAQLRRMLKFLGTPGVVHIVHRRIEQFPTTDSAGWLWTHHGGVAVAADGTISPSSKGVDIDP